MTDTTPISLEDYISGLTSETEIAGLNDRLVAMLKQHGIVAVFAQTLPFGATPVKGIWEPVISTFPKEVVTFYRQHKCGDEDPFMEAAVAAGGPVHFAAQWKSFDWTPVQKKVFSLMFEVGLKDGIAMPVFAKPGVAAYFGLAFPEVQDDVPPAKIQMLHVICQQYFYRQRQISDACMVKTLTPRERQIIVGIINGKSNTVIAARLKISEHTVDTYVRRCFEKLGASNRVEAALKCLGNGYIARQLMQDAAGMSHERQPQEARQQFAS